MSEWLLQRSAASTFYIYPHKLLNQKRVPPFEIYLEGNAKPRDFHTPAHVPIY